MVPAKHFYMIRHGETTANKARKMAGSLDSLLRILAESKQRMCKTLLLI